MSDYSDFYERSYLKERERNAKLVAALETIASQELSDEIEEPEGADWQGGYDALIEIARAALHQNRSET